MSSATPRRLIFIVGVEGSGTTMMAEFLGASSKVEVVLGNYVSVTDRKDFAAGEMPETARQMKELHEATSVMWDRLADVAETRAAAVRLTEALTVLSTTEELSGTEYLVLKRSAPFFRGDRYRPDLLDVVDLMPGVKVLVMVRDPRASTFSALRRGFVENLRHGAIVCEEQLLLLSARIQSLDEGVVCLVAYEEFCRNPSTTLERVSSFVGLDTLEVGAALEGMDVRPAQNELWQTELDATGQMFLTDYFDNRRMAQLEVLRSAPH